jgi:hypothetical protein
MSQQTSLQCLAFSVLEIISSMLLYEDSLTCRMVSKSYRCIWEIVNKQQCKQVALILGECRTYPSNPFQDKYIRFFVAVRDMSHRIWSEIERTGFRSFVISNFPCAYCNATTKGADLYLTPFHCKAMQLRYTTWEKVKITMAHENTKLVFFLCGNCLLSGFCSKKWTPEVQCSVYANYKKCEEIPAYILVAMVMGSDDDKHVCMPFSTRMTKVSRMYVSIHLTKILAITREFKLGSSLEIMFHLPPPAYQLFSLKLDHKETTALLRSRNEGFAGGSPSTVARTNLLSAVTPQPSGQELSAVNDYLLSLLDMEHYPTTSGAQSRFMFLFRLTMWKRLNERTYLRTYDNTLIERGDNSYIKVDNS